MNIIKNENKLTLLIILAICCYILFLLFFNIAKGFDITDESFYILNYTNYSELSSTAVTLFRYPLALLNYLAFDNLLILRFISILILIFSTIWLGYEFIKYTNNIFDFYLTKIESINAILVIFVGIFSYYKLWLITPSYNWLALVSCILFYAIFFNIINNKSNNIFKYFFISLILVLSFCAKPTTTIILIVVSLFIFYVEYKKFNVKLLFLFVPFSSILILISLVIFTYGNLNTYLYFLNEHFNLMKIMQSGHGLTDLIENYVYIINKFFFEKFLLNTSIYYILIISIIILFIISTFIIKDVKKIKKYFEVIVTCIIFFYGVLLLYTLLNTNGNINLLGLFLIELILYLLFLMIIHFIFIDNKDIKKVFRKFFLISFFLLLGIFGYIFGTNTNFVYKLTEPLVFFYMLILMIALFLDKKLNIRFIKNIINGILVLSILILIYKAYSYPYRQNSISQQKYLVSFTDKNYKLYVDEKNKIYIDTLKELSKKYKFKETGYLLDMTGGTPGANVILNGKFFTRPWLAGGYPNSNKMVFEILKKYKENNNLKQSWILIAPNGKRSLNLNILDKLELNFPINYRKIGTLITSHRNERQELWIPKIKKIKD